MKTQNPVLFYAMTLTVSLIMALPGVAQTSDTTPPKLLSLAISPTSVNVTSAPASVTVTARVTDDLSGAIAACLSFRSPSFGQSTPQSCLFRISGTALDGIYQGTITIPQSSEAGTWIISYLQLYDSAGNFTVLQTADLQALNFPTELAVLSTTADLQPPQITSLTITPPSVNVSAGPQNITVRLGLTDNLSGVDFTRFLEFRVTMRGPSPTQEQYISGRDFTLISGTQLNGVWEATHQFPKDAAAGTWSIASLILNDLAANQRFLQASDLRTMGFNPDFNIVSATPDTTPPQLTGFSFTPPLIDTTAGPASVTVRLDLTDDRSGASFALDNPNVSYFHGVQFRSPSGGQSRSTGSFTLIGGTPLNGIWQGSVFFPQYSEAGTWTASVFRLKDTVNNFFNLDATQLATKGFLTQLVLYQPNLTPDGSLGASGGMVEDSVFKERAKVVAPSGVLPGTTSFAIDVLSTNLGVPDPAGFEQGSFYVNFNFQPSVPMPLPPPGLTVTLPLQTQKPPGTPITLFRLDPITGLVPAERSVPCPSLMSQVDPGGFSATFTCVARFSTLVAFIPTAVPGDVNGDGTVNCADLAIVRAAFGKRSGQAGFDSRADLNRDGVVNVVDLGLVSRQLPPGTTCP